MSTKPFRVDNDIRIVEFLNDDPESALSDAVLWLEEKDADGRKNVFYFIDLKIEHEAELGWLVSIYCGLPKKKQLKARKH